jgi:hypothetical protein
LGQNNVSTLPNSLVFTTRGLICYTQAGNIITNKQLVIETGRELPDEASLDEIAERIAILAAIRKGGEDADAGRIISNEELQRRMKTWISK